MRTVFHDMFGGAIDYAGLFPPASLPLKQAAANYAKYLRCDYRWLLGSFVVPVAMLDQADSLDAPCLIGSGDFESDAQKIMAYSEAHPEAAPFTYELKISSPKDVLKVKSHIAKTKVPIEEVYFESSDLSNEVIAAVRELEFHSDTLLGYKLRCGGVNAVDFPSTEILANNLSQCRGIPIKFTAGLHHPLRRWDDAIGAHMHGFVNVIAAGFLNEKYRLPVETMAAILEDSNPNNYHFGEEVFSWGDYKLSSYRIATKRELFPGFGSCSFDDPRNDLRAIGWM